MALTQCLLIIITAGLWYWWYRCRKFTMNVLQRSGISGPVPHLIKGDLKEYLSTPNVPWDSKLINSYGPICGYYIGAKPMILAADLELIKKIQSSAGDHFLDRPRRVPGGINPDLKRAEMLGNLNVPAWKALRRVLSKAFSPEKRKQMCTDTQNLIQVFMSCVAPADNPTGTASYSVNFYDLYKNLTLDLIGKAGFGIESDIQRNPNDTLKAAVEQEFSKSTGSFLLQFYLCFPEVRWLLQPFRVWLEKVKVRLGWGGRSELWDLGLATVVSRKLEIAEKNGKGRNSDILHLMLTEGLTETAVIANSVLFFEAGFETLSASLAFITHLLITHVDVQENVRAEIKEILDEEGGQLENDHKLLEFKYLDAVIKEGLRMYPPQTTFIGRSGDVDIAHEYEWNGRPMTSHIPKNVHIQIALWQIMNSEQIWESPREFRPQRFLNELTSEQNIAYQPFGRGKRICLGMKYADVVLKRVLIELLSKFKLVLNDRTEEGEIEVDYKTATMTPKNGVFGNAVWDPLFPKDCEGDRAYE